MKKEKIEFGAMGTKEQYNKLWRVWSIFSIITLMATGLLAAKFYYLICWLIGSFSVLLYIEPLTIALVKSIQRD